MNSEPAIRRDEDTGDFLYKTVILGPYTGPILVDHRLRVEDGVVDCRTLPYREAKRVAPVLRDKGYDVRFPEKPWLRKVLEKYGLL